MSEASDTSESEVSRYFDNYLEYAKTVRAWLVAYGVGGPVLLATNDAIAAKVGASGHAAVIAYLFLGAVAAQVLIALTNKWSAWFVYWGSDDADVQDWRSYRATTWLSRQAWIDILIDLVSVALLLKATALLLSILTGPPVG